MSRRSRSRDRGRTLYRADPDQESRVGLNEKADPDFDNVYKFVKSTFKIYSEDHAGADIVARPSDQWSHDKGTNRIEAPFTLRSIPDCRLFCLEMEMRLQTTRLTLEWDTDEFVLKASFRDVLAASRQHPRLLSWFGLRARVINAAQLLFLAVGIITCVIMLGYFMFA
jgi:hypothetical protein